MNKKCQVFTPPDYVEKLLDSVGYKRGLYGKKILENSCGDGNILTVIVQRYIDDCRAHGLSRTIIKNGLRRDIIGVEIDKEQLEKCLNNLNRIIEKNGIKEVKWQIINGDYLREKILGKFDYIVGNPPYITYSELTMQDRKFLRKKYISCKKGKFDYCYAFLEKSIESLSSKGKMAYLIPSSVYKTVFGKEIRDILHPLVTEIIDYTQEKLFKKALVKSSIIVLHKKNSGGRIHYVDDTVNVDKYIAKEKLEEKWLFYPQKHGGRRFGDYFRVSHVVATLCNKVFVKTKWNIDENGNYLLEGESVEAEVVRETASPRLYQAKERGIIIFPYSYSNDNELSRYTEKEFEERFPGAYSYLKKYKELLDKRDSDITASWFEYGRSQALNKLYCEKLLVSTIVSGDMPVYRLSKECIPYAGMFITAKGVTLSLDDGMDILNKKEFLSYAKNVGIPINGKSVRITSKDIENYLF